jgi:hypothetical protein
MMKYFILILIQIQLVMSTTLTRDIMPLKIKTISSQS